MRTRLHRPLRLPALLCAGLLAAVTCARAAEPAPPAFTPRDAFDSLFELEGNAPFAAPYEGTLTFSALASRFATANGHGYRNELKIASRHRRTVEQTRERFSAIVTPTLPDGARTIVAQYHVEGLDTILKVYVQDTAAAGLPDGIAGNGIFDIVVKMLEAGGKEVGTSLGTVRSGQSFALGIRFDQGVATVTADTAAMGALQAGPTRIEGDRRTIYFKFGDYLQALDPVTGRQTTIPSRWDAYLRKNGIENSMIRFSRTVFVRD
jgi:hypothetical protein